MVEFGHSLEVDDFEFVTRDLGNADDIRQRIDRSGHNDFSGSEADRGLGPSPAAVAIRDHLDFIDDSNADWVIEIGHFDGTSEVAGIFDDKMFFARDHIRRDATFIHPFTRFHCH